MIQTVQFVKLSGSGNDFICIDNRDGRYDDLISSKQRVEQFSRVCCHRGLGVGADGVIFACNNEVEGFADVSARHFEPDGSEAELCGNGVACFTRWAIDNGWVVNHEVKILTTAGVVRGKILDDGFVRACIPLPEDFQTDLELEVKGRRWNCDFVVTGVPHLVTYVENLDRMDLPHWGPGFRYHPRFAPRGVNANFVQVLGEGSIALRTWEFGVEGETLACGTGSAAAAILTTRRFGWPKKYLRGDVPVLVKARSGETLRIYFAQQDDGAVTDLCLETRVHFLFAGSLNTDLAKEALEGSGASRGA